MSDAAAAEAAPNYDDTTPKLFIIAAVVFGAGGMLVGLYIALELAFPALNFDLPWLTFGRLRPLHTSAVIFAFAANIVFAGIYHSSQRLLWIGSKSSCRRS